jgi:hypothetical protein
MSLNPSAGAVLRTFKIQRRGDDDDFDCECGLIDFRKWASDKEALLPWLCLDGFNPNLPQQKMDIIEANA